MQQTCPECGIGTLPAPYFPCPNAGCRLSSSSERYEDGVSGLIYRRRRYVGITTVDWYWEISA